MSVRWKENFTSCKKNMSTKRRNWQKQEDLRRILRGRTNSRPEDAKKEVQNVLMQKSMHVGSLGM